MRTGSRLFRLSLWLATTSLSFTAASPAFAQPTPQTDAPPAAAGDPPALAGRLSALTGTVSTHAAGVTEWSTATLNNPVTNGDSFWTEPQGSATIEIGSDHFVMSEATELDVTQLDQSQFVATEAQGELYLGLRDLPDGQNLTINTPRGAVQITATGQYDIVAGDSATPTTITVIAGSALVTGSGVNLTVAAQQTATVTGDSQFSGTLGPAQQDAFLQAQLTADIAPAPQAAAPRQVRYMTGGSDLGRYGAWRATQQYGQVWYPSDVASDWAPYRDGHWAYVGPWGWTWVDDEPWGFAPFHYGRWVDVDNRWGWVAAAPDAPYNDYPVYAPALVGFVGIGAGLLIGAEFGGYGDGGVGWVPLGFREPYYPWYHTSDRYLQNVNRISVVNVTNINIRNERAGGFGRFANARGATVIPAGAMVRGERLRGLARPLPAAALDKGRPVLGRLPVRPTSFTPGLSRGEARRFNVALPARPAGRAAPGPAVRPGGVLAHPALRPAIGIARPGAGASDRRPGLGEHPGAPGPHIVAPGAARQGGLPALRPAGETHVRPAPGAPFGARPAPGAATGALEHRPGEARPAGNPPAGLRQREPALRQVVPVAPRAPAVPHPVAPRPPAATHPKMPRVTGPTHAPATHVGEARPQRQPEPRTESRPTPHIRAASRPPESHPAPRPAPAPRAARPPQHPAPGNRPH